MTKVKIAVVEDEKIFADLLCHTLRKLGYEPLEPATSYSEALATIEEHKPDLAMLDIRLSGNKDGIDLAWKIKKEYNIPFIFLTSNADKLTIDRAKKLNPPAYLVKPFNRNEIYTSIEIALYNYALDDVKDKSNLVINDALFIKQKNTFVKVKFDNILFIKSDHVYLEIITVDDNKYLVRDSLGNYLNKLNSNFIRVHRGYIINMSHLKAIDSHIVKISEHDIPIGKNFRDGLMSKINVG